MPSEFNNGVQPMALLAPGLAPVNHEDALAALDRMRERAQGSAPVPWADLKEERDAGRP